MFSLSSNVWGRVEIYYGCYVIESLKLHDPKLNKSDQNLQNLFYLAIDSMQIKFIEFNSFNSALRDLKVRFLLYFLF